MKSEILDLGCGKKKSPGATGIDNDPRSDADILWDLTKFPWPIKDNTYTMVLCNNIVEHLPDLVRTLEELHRICKPGAVIKINTPHCSSCYAWSDLTHVRAMNTKAWRKVEYYYSDKFDFKIKDIKITKTLPRRRKITVSNPRWIYILETYFIYLLGGFDGLFVDLEVMK